MATDAANVVVNVYAKCSWDNMYGFFLASSVEGHCQHLSNGNLVLNTVLA